MKRIRYFIIVLILTILWMVVMRISSPDNIVAFEFAGTVDKAREIIQAWGTGGVEQARLGTYLDFIFLLLYSASISMGCRMAVNFSKVNWLIKIGNTLTPVIWLAGVCDAIENIALLNTLQKVTQSTVTVAFYSAAIKFTIVSVGLLFIFTAYMVGLLKRLK
jgi:hypothetical protein